MEENTRQREIIRTGYVGIGTNLQVEAWLQTDYPHYAINIGLDRNYSE